MDISHEERGQGHFKRKEGALPFISSSVALPTHPRPRPVFSHGLGPSSPSRKQMRKTQGGRGSWPPWPQRAAIPACFFLLLMATGANGTRVPEAWQPGWPGARPSSRSHALLTSKTLTRSLGCWFGQGAGLCSVPKGRVLSPQKWAPWPEASGVRDGRRRAPGLQCSWLGTGEGSGSQPWLFQFWDSG